MSEERNQPTEAEDTELIALLESYHTKLMDRMRAVELERAEQLRRIRALRALEATFPESEEEPKA